MILSLLTLSLLSTASPAAPMDFGAAQWIWSGEHPAVHFRRGFEVGQIKSAVLHITCDNEYTVYLNGEKRAQDGDWATGEVVDLTKFVRSGRNVLAIRGFNEGGPAALLARLVVEEKDQVDEIVTDARWLASSSSTEGWEKPAFDASSWQPADVIGKFGMEPWGRIPLAREQSEVPVELKTLPGFTAEMLYRVPKGMQGSWVSIANDPQGRLVVSDQYGSLYRVTPGGGEVATQVEELDTELGKAHGLLFAFDSLYVVGHGPSGTGLYRLRDTDGDDQFDQTDFLQAFRVGGEHDGHAVLLGPDNYLYLVLGNFTRTEQWVGGPSPFDYFKDDWLLEQHPPPSGHNAKGRPPGGTVLRTDKDAKHWEMICGGYRNPYDMAFNKQGELFVYDADMEYDSGTPWYRPTRVNHAISGADFGWRRGAAKWPEHYADSLGSVVDVGYGSPTGVHFGYGAKFPAKYQRALYLNDWTYGRIRAVHLQEDGASYTGTIEDFVVGRPLPLTDSVIGRDGHLYFLVGGRKTQSKLYRVAYTGPESTQWVDAPADPAAAAARALRRELEARHKRVGPEAVDFAWPHLGSFDRALRHAARLAVEHQSVELWRDRSLRESRTQALITAMVALARRDDGSSSEAALGRLFTLDLEVLPDAQVAEALRAAALHFIHGGPSTQAMRVEIIALLDQLLPALDRRVNMELVRLLVYLESPGVVAKAVQLVRDTRLQEDQMFYVNAIRGMRERWSVQDRVTYFEWINRARFSLRGGEPFDAGGYFNYSGGRSFRPYVNQIREQALRTLSEQELGNPGLRLVLDAEQPPAPIGAPALQLQSQPRVWSVADLRPLLNGLASGRSFETGRAAFEAVSCARCHKLGTFAGDVSLGPDLDTAGSRYSAADLLESIIEPSKVVSDQHLEQIFLTEDGEFFKGVVVQETDDEVMVRQDPLKSAAVTLSKDQIRRRKVATTSPMPTGLLNPLTEEQILDLIAYILTAADPEAAAFRQPADD